MTGPDQNMKFINNIDIHGGEAGKCFAYMVRQISAVP